MVLSGRGARRGGASRRTRSGERRDGGRHATVPRYLARRSGKPTYVPDRNQRLNLSKGQRVDHEPPRTPRTGLMLGLPRKPRLPAPKNTFHAFVGLLAMEDDDQ